MVCPHVDTTAFGCCRVFFFLFHRCIFGVAGLRTILHCLLHLLLPLEVALIAFDCIWIASSVRAISFAFAKAKSLPRAMHFCLTSSESVPKTNLSRTRSSCKSGG